MKNIPVSNEQRGQLIRAVLADPNLKDSEAYDLWQLLDPNVSPDLFESFRLAQHRPAKPLSEDDALQFVISHCSLDELLTELAGKAFAEATGLRAAGYLETAQKLEELAEVLGCAFVPEVGTKR